MTLARAIWQYGEPVHAVTYYATERREATDALGLRGGWMSYFGCRAAPLGAVSAALVTAVFFNFHPKMVGRAIPDAWTYASPEALLDARISSMDPAFVACSATTSWDRRPSLELQRWRLRRLTPATWLAGHWAPRTERSRRPPSRT